MGLFGIRLRGRRIFLPSLCRCDWARRSVYIADALKHRVQKFTPEGVFVTKWGSMGPGNQQFYNGGPRGIAAASDGSVYVADSWSGHRVLKFSDTFATVNELGTTATFTAALDAQPSSDVVLSVTSADTGELTISPATLTFTNANWNNAQPVTVTGVDDATADGDQATTVTISVVDASSADAYDSIADKILIVTTSDSESIDPGPTPRPSPRVTPTSTSSVVFVRKWGTYGMGDGQLKVPNGVAVASGGRVYVGD